jgi:hypothetical protein
MFGLHQLYWSYEYPDFLNSDGDFVEFDFYLVPESDLEDGALRMLPSISELDTSLRAPEPPVTSLRDGDLFERLARQKSEGGIRSYISTSWGADTILDQAHKNRVLELANNSGELGRNGYSIGTSHSGVYKGEMRVFVFNATANAKELLSIIQP